MCIYHVGSNDNVFMGFGNFQKLGTGNFDNLSAQLSTVSLKVAIITHRPNLIVS